MKTNFYINVQGGLGLNAALASFLTEAKKYHPDDKYYVTSPYFDIFLACEAIDYVYKPNEIRDFLFDAKNDTNSKIINNRLYDLDSFIRKESNYSEAWAELLGYKWNKEIEGTSVKSILNPCKAFPSIIQQVQQVRESLAQRGFSNYVIMQFTGGQSPLQEAADDNWSTIPYDYLNEPLKRHYPIEKAQEFIDKFTEQNPNTGIILYQLPNEPAPANTNTIRISIPYLAYYELAKEAIGVISIDSSLQHLVAGVTKTVVIWGHTLPRSFGYSYNKNIIQDCRRDDILYFTALGPSGSKINYISPDELLNTVNSFLFDSKCIEIENQVTN
jgi:hypothetical protein